MSPLTFENPVFAVYAVAAALMVAKTMTHSWITVYRMLKVKGGYRLPEDLRRTPLNPDPRPDQLAPNEYVERSRRIHQNELENVPLFLAIGLLFVCTEPRLALAGALFAGYVVSRLVHFHVVMSQGTHDARAAAWTVGSLIVYAMVVLVIVHSVTRLLASS
jgi:glutathione S-transferase